MPGTDGQSQTKLSTTELEWVCNLEKALNIQPCAQEDGTEEITESVAPAQILQFSEENLEPSDDETDLGEGLNKAELEEYLAVIQDNLKNGTQIKPRFAAPTDKKFMSALVELANEKKPGLNAKFCSGPEEMAETVTDLIQNKVSSARFVVNMGENEFHFAAYDFAMVDGGPSVISVEPTTLDTMASGLLAVRAADAFQTQCPEVAICFIESDLQRSNGECGIFSLALVKKMHKEAEHFKHLHEQNVNSTLPKDDIGAVSVADADKLLPPSLMKHAQSEKRLAQYVKANPKASEAKINSKGETLQERQARHVVDIKKRGKNLRYSNSIERKRETEVRALRDKL